MSNLNYFHQLKSMDNNMEMRQLEQRGETEQS